VQQAECQPPARSYSSWRAQATCSDCITSGLSGFTLSCTRAPRHHVNIPAVAANDVSLVVAGGLTGEFLSEYTNVTQLIAGIVVVKFVLGLLVLGG